MSMFSTHDREIRRRKGSCVGGVAEDRGLEATNTTCRGIKLLYSLSVELPTLVRVPSEEFLIVARDLLSLDNGC